MPVRKANAEWRGDLKGGSGKLSTESGVLKDVAYNFSSRFEEGDETNPEELVGAAHAACFSMALANNLSNAGFKVNLIKTEDKIRFEKREAGFTITNIELNTEADVVNIDEETFMKFAEETKATCPIARALNTSIEITMNAKLKQI